MGDQGRSGRLRDFLLGGIVGAFAALAAARRRAPSGTGAGSSSGLAPFESAPCYRETLEQGVGSKHRS